MPPHFLTWLGAAIATLGLGVLALSGGIQGWETAGQPVASTRLFSPRQIDPAEVIDVRQANEYSAGHLPGARNIELGALARHAADMPAGPVVTMCGHGERATTAASVLERAGQATVAVSPVGAHDWAGATGRALESTA